MVTGNPPNQEESVCDFNDLGADGPTCHGSCVPNTERGRFIVGDREMIKIRQWLEDMMVAATFAEAGDDEEARRIMRAGKRKTKVARKHLREEQRLELRAPGPEG